MTSRVDLNIPYSYTLFVVSPTQNTDHGKVDQLTGIAVQLLTLTTCYCTYYANGWGDDNNASPIFIGV